MQQYLQIDSCHSRHRKTTISFWQTLCLCRICSKQDNLQKWCQELKHHLIKRGYDEQQLDLEIQLALDTPKETDLQQRNDQGKSARIPLVVAYHLTLPSLGITTRPLVNILYTSERLQKAFSSPLLIAFRRLKIWRDFLVGAELRLNT